MMVAEAPPRLALPPLRGRVQFDAPLAPTTWFRVGGPAEALVRPADAEDLCAFLAGLAPDRWWRSVRHSNWSCATAACSAVIACRRLQRGRGRVTAWSPVPRRWTTIVDAAAAGLAGPQIPLRHPDDQLARWR